MRPAHIGQPHRAIILTALEVEYLAVRAHMHSVRTERHHHGTLYEIGRFDEGSVTWEVLIAEIGAGNNSASVEAERAIEYFGPEVVLFAGVAGALKDARIGDVVAATKVYNYASGKDDMEFLPRPDLGVADYGLEQRARFERKSPDWLRRIVGGEPSPAPRVFVAPIAAGEKVISSRSSPPWRFIRNNYSDAVAVEMEGRGVLAAAHANVHVRAMVIRGISDLVGGQERGRCWWLSRKSFTPCCSVRLSDAREIPRTRNNARGRPRCVGGRLSQCFGAVGDARRAFLSC